MQFESKRQRKSAHRTSMEALRDTLTACEIGLLVLAPRAHPGRLELGQNRIASETQRTAIVCDAPTLRKN